MGDANDLLQPVGQYVLARLDVLEYAKALLREAAAAQSIEMKHGCVRGQTGKERGLPGTLKAVKQGRHGAPERLVFQIGHTRFGPRDDEGVQRRISDGVGTAIALCFKMMPACVTAGNARQGKQTNLDRDAWRCLNKEALELQFCSRQSGVWHIVDEADANAWAVNLARVSQNGRHLPVEAISTPFSDSGRLDRAGDTGVQAAASACDKSAMISSMCSMPMDSRIISGVTPARASS